MKKETGCNGMKLSGLYLTLRVRCKDLSNHCSTKMVLRVLLHRHYDHQTWMASVVPTKWL